MDGQVKAMDGQRQAMEGQLKERNAARLQAGKLVEATKLAADAATKSSDIAAEALLASNRPWIALDTEIGPLAVGSQFKAKLVFKNVGRSPASQFRVLMTSGLSGGGEPLPPPILEMPPDDAGIRHPGVLLPGSDFQHRVHWGSSNPTWNDIDAIKRRRTIPWFNYRIEYEDAAGTIRFVVLRGLYDPENHALTPLPGNRAN